MNEFGDKPRTRVAILGCTGSIGSQSLDVCRQHKDKLDVVALSAHTRTKELVAAAREFNAQYVAVTDEAHKVDPALDELPSDIHLLYGSDSLVELATLDEVDVVLLSVVGAIGLKASYAAITSGKRLAIANKEPLVAAGELLMPLVSPGQLIPVDSEHSAIFQCLMAGRPSEVERIWLTCSGGPFFGYSSEQLSNVTKKDALAHPNWSMGAKISIDSATLMNKGLECIEAMHLFNLSMDDIEVLIHRESKIHSMVEYVDGSVIAQLGPSDMRIPIQLAFSYPNRWDSSVERIDYRQMGNLTFDTPDDSVFRCLKLAHIAGRRGGTLPCAMNAANEVAVAAFLQDACSFTDIARIVEHTMDAHDTCAVEGIDQLLDVDTWARTFAQSCIA